MWNTTALQHIQKNYCKHSACTWLCSLVRPARSAGGSSRSPRASSAPPPVQAGRSHHQGRGAAAAGGRGSSSRHCLNRYDDGAASTGSHLLKSLTKQISQSDSITELSDLVEEWGGTLNAICVSAAFARLAKLRCYDSAAQERVLDRLAVLWDQCLPAADVQGLANVLWACGKLRYCDHRLWRDTVEAFVEKHKGAAKPQAYGNAAYALASIAVCNNGTVPGLTSHEVVDVLGQITEEVFVMAAAPYTTVNPRDVNNILWAHAKLKTQPAAEDLQGLLKAFVRPQLLGEATGQDMANIMWAVSQLQSLPGWEVKLQEEFWDKLLAEPQLVKICRSEVDSSAVLLALATMAAPMSLSTPVMPLTAARTYAHQLLQKLSTEQLCNWGEQAVANAVYACGRLGVHDERFLQQVAISASSWLSGASSDAVSQIAQGMGKLSSYRNEQLLAQLVQRTKQLLAQGQSGKSRLNHRDLAKAVVSVSWAIAVVDVPRLAVQVQQLIQDAHMHQVASTFHPIILSRLWVVHMWLLTQQGASGGSGLTGLLTEQQLEQCEEAAAAEAEAASVAVEAIEAQL